MHKVKILLMVFIFLFLVCLKGFGQYADLVGKWVKINGPFGWRILGVALDEDTCDELILMSRHAGRINFDKTLNSFNVLRIKNHTHAVVIEVKLFEGKAKVLLLSGMYKGMSGWVPLEWLDGNQERPALAKIIP